MYPRASNSKVTTRVRQLTLREPFSLLDHRDQLDLNHCLWLSETADLDRRAGRTGYPDVAHAHVGALRERLVVRDEGVGLDNIGPRCAGGLEAGVEVLEGLFELRPHVARADDVALCVACQLAGDVDRLTGACDRDDVRIGGLPLLHADVHARRLDPVDLHGHALSRSRCSSPPRMPLRSRHCNRAKLPTLGIPQRLEAGHETPSSSPKQTWSQTSRHDRNVPISENAPGRLRLNFGRA